MEVPQSLGDEIKALSRDDNNETAGRFTGRFSVDPSIPLPVELDRELTDIKSLAENLTWEMILTGMIRVLYEGKKAGEGESPIEGVQPHWLDYYRHFVLMLKPDIYNEFTGAAIIKARNTDFDDALEIIAALEGLFPFSPEVLLNKALIQEEEAADMERKGREMEAALENDKALDTYTRALDMEPVLPELLYNVGIFYTRKKNFSKALEYFTEYLSAAEDSAKKEKAETIIKEIKSKGLDDFKYYESIELIRRGREEEALLLIRDFLEEHPKVWNAWFILGWALRKTARWKDALESFRKALELGGGTPDTLNETAICLMELGDFTGARKELETALREDPENLKIISNLGILALKKGDTEEAAGFFRIVLELNPLDPIALKFFAGRTA